MTTGTPLDLTPFGAVLTGLGIVYWLLAAGAMLLAVLKPKSLKNKSLATVAVLLVFGWSPALEGWARYKAQQKFNVAMARFEERCKTAGEKITRTVDDVEGILLMKVRPAKPSGADSDPMWPGAALASESSQDEFIETFLWYEWRGKGFEQQRGNVTNKPSDRPGYRYVDVLDGADGKRYRYTAPLQPRSPSSIEKIQKLTRELTTQPLPAYGVTYEDIVDPEDRKYWIAGTVIRIVDLSNNQTVAEQKSFLMDTGLGSTGGFRSPWGWASHYGKQCPRFSGNLSSHTRFFVDQILKPKKGE